MDFERCSLSEATPLLRPTTPGDVEAACLKTADVTLNFDAGGDKDNPREWPAAFKWAIVLLLASMSFTVTFTCICVVPIAGQITSDLDGRDSSSSSGSALLVTIWELGEAAGPLFIAPLSEVYGRYPVMNIANLLFVSATLFAALCTSTRLFIGARALTGLAVAVNVLNPAIIGDMFESDQRGSAMSAVMLAPLIGGAIGPAFSGAVSEMVGWRTVLLIAAGLAFSCELMFLCCFRETYKMAILRRRARKLRDEAGDHGLDAVPVVARQGLDMRLIWHSISRPVTILFGSRVLFPLAMLGSVSFSYFYVMSVSLPYMLEDIYGFSPAQVGASFVAFSIGSIVAVGLCNVTLDRVYIKLRGSGEDQPEYRLPLAIFAALALPFAVSAYGWIAEWQLPVWLLLVSAAVIDGTILLVMVPLSAYVVDACGDYSASAMTGIIVTRCLMGTFLPLATGPVSEWLGYGWGMTVLAALSLGLAPVPLAVMRHGKRWRQGSEFTRGA